LSCEGRGGFIAWEKAHGKRARQNYPHRGRKKRKETVHRRDQQKGPAREKETAAHFIMQFEEWGDEKTTRCARQRKGEMVNKDEPKRKPRGVPIAHKKKKRLKKRLRNREKSKLENQGRSGKQGS